MANPLVYHFWHFLKRSHLISEKKFVRKTVCFTPEYKLIEDSDYFDKKWYLLQNPVLLKKRKDPVAHYLLKGWKAGKSPSAKFDNNDYIFHHQEIWNQGINPLIHFEHHRKENNYTICPCSTLPKDKKLSADGLSIVSNLVNIYGQGQTAKDFLAMLNAADIKYEVKTTYIPGRQIISSEEYKKFNITPYLRYKTRLIMDIDYEFYESEYDDIKTVWWEFTSGLPEFNPKVFEGVKAIIVFSDFCYNYVKTIIPDRLKLYKVIYPFTKNWTINKSIEETRHLYHLKSTDFVCFFNFDYRSSYIRKNPDGVIRAFAQALGENDNAYLIIKTIGFDGFPKWVHKLEELTSQLNVQDKVIFVNDYMSRDDLVTLINACDVYLSLHRGEGLGLGMLEAMSMGKPIVGTNYGGNTEFMSSDNSCLVNYQMVSAKKYDIPPYEFVKKYAEPDIAHAAAYLEQLYKDSELRKTIGQKAQSFVETYYNPQTFKQQILNIIEESK